MVPFATVTVIDAAVDVTMRRTRTQPLAGSAGGAASRCSARMAAASEVIHVVRITAAEPGCLCAFRAATLEPCAGAMRGSLPVLLIGRVYRDSTPAADSLTGFDGDGIPRRHGEA